MGLASFNRIRRLQAEEKAKQAAAAPAPAPEQPAAVIPPAPPATGTEAPPPAPPAGESVPAVVEGTSTPPAAGEQVPTAVIPPVATEPTAEELKEWAGQNIDTIRARVSAGEITVEHALKMERARGEDARPTLIRRLTPQAD